ncbi:unnamed protein product [Cylicostephanus goldi]|uniref:Uncharacterized protein n=1 Tax=Cylicostephanus goldi TaxID=71465 RepID=A0A3P7QN94_CYLGO|nr:unnamed protein product [Cylicostephanus goldi]
MEEALADFLAAYELKPEWIENLVWLIRTYLALNDKANAKKYINKLLVLTPANEDERDKVNEAKKLLAKC